MGAAGIKSATPLVSITIPPKKFCRKLSFNSRIFLILLSICCLSFKTERAGISSDPLVKFVKLITSHLLLFLFFYIFTSSRVQVKNYKQFLLLGCKVIIKFYILIQVVLHQHSKINAFYFGIDFFIN